MKFLRNPEVRGILVLGLIILVIGAALAAVTGRLEVWFNIPWLSGPRITDSIVFVSGRADAGDLWAMKTDGSGRRRLTSGAKAVGAPAISPAGNRIAFVGVVGNQSQIYSIGAEGGEPNQLTSGGVPKRKPGFSPDGKHLSYISAGKVYVADVDGGNPRAVLPTREELHATVVNRAKIPTYTDYSWGPDSRSLAAVTRGEDGNDSLTYLENLSGEAQTIAAAAVGPEGDGAVIFLPKPEDRPVALMPLESGERLRIEGTAWASDRPLLAAVLTAGKNSVILAMDVQEKTVRPVFAVRDQKLGALTVSSDGSQAVVCLYAADEKHPGGLLRVDLDSGDAALIVRGAFEQPSFSPDGEEVLTTSVEAGKRDVVVVDVSTGVKRKLTHDGASFGAIWTPASAR